MQAKNVGYSLLFCCPHAPCEILPLLFLHGSYLVTVMGLVIPWSFTLAMVDGYSVLVKCPLRQPGILLIIVVGDWVRINTILI